MDPQVASAFLAVLMLLFTGVWGVFTDICAKLVRRSIVQSIGVVIFAILTAFTAVLTIILLLQAQGVIPVLIR